MKILYIEDNSGDARYVQEQLAADNCRLHTVSRLSEAEAAIRKHTPDLVLLDLNLPDSQGLDTLRAIRRLNDSVPIIIYSGAALDVDKAIAAKDLGAMMLSKSVPLNGVLVPLIISMAEPLPHVRRTFRTSLENMRQHLYPESASVPI